MYNIRFFIPSGCEQGCECYRYWTSHVFKSGDDWERICEPVYTAMGYVFNLYKYRGNIDDTNYYDVYLKKK